MLSKCHIASITIGVLLVAGAIVLMVGKYPEKFINSEIDKQLAISQDSPLFDDWVNPPPPIYMQYWVFNVTNPQDVIDGKKGNVTEIGPFTYRLYQPRYNVAFYDNDTVSYQYNHTLVLDLEKSVDDPNNVTITNVNVPLITVLVMIKNIHLPLPAFVERLFLKLLFGILGESELFPKHTAHELLFGYEDHIFTLGHKYLPEMIPAQFGLFYGFNNTDDGVYLINSGKTEIMKVNDVEKWNHETYLNYWSDLYGNMLNGTDGVFFHPNMSKAETVYAYSTDICRSLPFAYELGSEVAGIDAYRYHTTEMAFANTTVNPNNAAFCVPAGNCMGSGVLNISVCKQNAPVVISSPHFYLGDRKYVEAVNGLNPNKAEHETYLDIEPTTGTVLQAQKRLQMNIQMEPSKDFGQLNNVKTTTFPFAWLNESVYIDNDSANHLKSVFMLKKFVLSTPYILFGIAAIIFIVVIATLIYRRRKNPEVPLLTNVDYDGENDDE